MVKEESMPLGPRDDHRGRRQACQNGYMQGKVVVRWDGDAIYGVQYNVVREVLT